MSHTRRGIATSVALMLILSMTAALEAAPATGDFMSTEFGGLVLDGRWTEGYAGGLPNVPGNGNHAASWDGATLGGQWELTGLTLQTTTLLSGPAIPPAGGVATQTWERVFDGGGQLILKDTGPWWTAGDPGTEYVVNLTSYVQTLVVTYFDEDVVIASSIETFAGTFAGNPLYEISYGQTVGAWVGQGALPADYPAYEPGGTVLGAYGVAQKIRFTVTEVPEPATMGLLGIGLTAFFVRRKRK